MADCANVSVAEFRETLTKLHYVEENSDSSGKYYLDVLKIITEHLKIEQCRKEMSADAFHDIKVILGHCFERITVNSDNSQETGKLYYESRTQWCTECFRILRNSCVQCPKNQDLIRDCDILLVVKQILLFYTSKHLQDSEDVIAIRCAVQFLGNLVAGNTNLQKRVWQIMFPEIFSNIFNLNDTKASIYSCMVIHNCLNDHHKQQLIKQPGGQTLVESILQLCKSETEQEWALHIIQDLVLNVEFFLTQYEEVSEECKLILLDIVSAMLDDPSFDSELSSQVNMDGDTHDSIPGFVFAFLAQQFEMQACNVLLPKSDKIDENTIETETLVVVQLLQILCLATSDLGKYKVLQKRTSLLHITLEMLQKAHAIGQSGDNRFTVSQTLTSAACSHTDNPVFGFKRDLIRLIGNMCYKNKDNQDMVRISEGIPLILEHCNIDEHNPFISQWAIFAIHNICEQNADNQDVIASMQNQGVADCKQLKELGVDVQERDGKIYVKTTKKTKAS
ncbi:ataxin-10-like [Saccoglossus kowalevskii]|uniref:Ataxin-10 n=1 Tax=Saccoglossus kowalevskii TaxID=10224 RepID=A0ABM0MAN5_SACKO|nr:PREDICTED: ataxin-10-like [Saccoglossus kowalevskii]